MDHWYWSHWSYGSFSDSTHYSYIYRSILCLSTKWGRSFSHTIGTLQISSTLTLTSVLCVPSFSLNLIFVSKFTIYFFCLIFLGDCCFIQDLAQWSMIGLGKESNRLYLLQDSNSRNAPTTLTANVGHTSPSNLWYHRLGHPSCSKLALLKQIIQFDISNKATCCDVCHYSKQKRLLLLLVLMYLLNLLNWFIVTYGVLLLLVLLMDYSNTSWPLWMILLDALGFTFLSISLKLNFYFLNLQLWWKLNLIVKSKQSEATMVLNFTWNISFILIVLYISCHVLIHLNKMQLLRESFSTFLMLPGH